MHSLRHVPRCSHRCLQHCPAPGSCPRAIQYVHCCIARSASHCSASRTNHRLSRRLSYGRTQFSCCLSAFQPWFHPHTLPSLRIAPLSTLRTGAAFILLQTCFHSYRRCLHSTRCCLNSSLFSCIYTNEHLPIHRPVLLLYCHIE